MKMQKWVKLPTNWITKDRKLRELRWTAKQGANNLAALMILIVIAQHADDTGLVALTYDRLGKCTGLSRAKISGGLKVLEEMALIKRGHDGRSSFMLANYDPSAGWGKLPARGLYSSDHIGFFSVLSMRRPAELHALKLYLLFVAMRNNRYNLATISYDKIEDYAGIERHQIKPALSVLAANGVVHIERTQASGEYGISNAYRIAFIEDFQHFGTSLRANMEEAEREIPF
jgi:hypothetical protein